MLHVQLYKSLAHFSIDVEFTVGNEIISLFGPSGSGKTTILNCIAGLSKAERGIIQWSDEVFFQNGKVLLPTQNRKIGYLFQDYALFPHMTVWKNIAYGMKSEAFAQNLMRELHIEHLTEKYPHQISGGEKQRVAITRALATEPEILLLDEPFSALDETNRFKSHEELLRIHQQWQIPIILVTHNHEEAKKLSNRILYMQDGKLIRKAQSARLKT